MSGKSKAKKAKRKRGRPPKKKTRQKKKVKKKTETPIKRNAPRNHYFMLCNGQPVKNIRELADIMEELEEQVFDHHVREDGNDFAKWVKDIFKDIKLAEKLAGAKDKKHIQLVIYKHITHKLW